jgi:hypothetical protein
MARINFEWWAYELELMACGPLKIGGSASELHAFIAKRIEIDWGDGPSRSCRYADRHGATRATSRAAKGSIASPTLHCQPVARSSESTQPIHRQSRRTRELIDRGDVACTAGCRDAASFHRRPGGRPYEISYPT